MRWENTPRQEEITAFVQSLRVRDSPYKHADSRRGQGLPGPTFELFAEPGDALVDCLAALWRRLLTAGREFADRFSWGLRGVDDGFVWSGLSWSVAPGDADDELPVGVVRVGIMPVGFRLHVPGLAGPPYRDEETEDEHECKILRVELAVYDAVRAAAHRPDILPLWQDAAAGRELTVRGSVRDGWVDLQIGQPTLGPLPEYDQRLLAGDPNAAEAIAPCRPLIPGAVPYNVVRGTDANPPS